MASFSLQWPNSLQALYGAMDSMSAGGTEIVAPDCLLNGAAVSTWFGSKVYVRGIIAAATPIIAILVIQIYWGARRRCGCCGKMKVVSSKTARQNGRIATVMLA